MDKRTFIKNSGLLGISGILGKSGLIDVIRNISSTAAEDLAGQEDFWMKIRNDYILKPDYINLENGYYCFVPEYTLERYINHIREVNYQGSYYMRTVQFENKKRIAEKLAVMAGCPADELIITRNATESLDIIISGFSWKPGDEAVMAEQDYPAMLNMFRQVSSRYGMINRIVSVPNHPQSDEEIVNLYERAITDKTRLLMVCHMINITGHILPVRKICDMAHKKGVDVMIDGAHTFGHIQFKIPDLGGDYFGSSLHKWLSVPIGAGILHVRKDRIAGIWPLLAEGDRAPDDITKLNHIGTHPVHTDLAIEDAIDYYNMLGGERKEARLRYLQNYWTSQVRQLPHIIINTPADPARSCGIANVGVQGMQPAELAETLMKEYGIYTVAIDGANVHGCRVTPNVYTSTEELDRFVEALTEISS